MERSGLDPDVLFAVVSSVLLILLLIAGITIVFFITGRQRIRQQVELAESKLAFERELRTVETEVTESIMTQFAQELHDNIGQLLTASHSDYDMSALVFLLHVGMGLRDALQRILSVDERA